MRSQDRPCSPATLGRRTRDGQPGPAPRADSEPHWPPVPAHACRGHTPHRRSEASWFLLFTRQFTDVGGNSKVHTAATEKCKKNLCHQNRKRNGISFLSEVSARVRMPPLDEELDTEGSGPHVTPRSSKNAQDALRPPAEEAAGDMHQSHWLPSARGRTGKSPQQPWRRVQQRKPTPAGAQGHCHSPLLTPCPPASGHCATHARPPHPALPGASASVLPMGTRGESSRGRAPL